MLIHIEGLACFVTVVILVLVFGFACMAYAKHFVLSEENAQLKAEKRALIKENFHLKVMKENDPRR